MGGWVSVWVGGCVGGCVGGWVCGWVGGRAGKRVGRPARVCAKTAILRADKLSEFLLLLRR